MKINRKIPTIKIYSNLAYQLLDQIFFYQILSRKISPSYEIRHYLLLLFENYFIDQKIENFLLKFVKKL